MQVPSFCLAALLCCLLFGCGGNFNPMSNLTTVTEPREGAFTIQLPSGWTSGVSLERPYEQTRSRGFAKSPDGNSCIFFGDVKMPMYYVPSPQYGMRTGMNMGSPLLQVKPFVPADTYFEDYVKKQFGKLPGFQLVSNTPSEAHRKLLEIQAQKLGINPTITTAAVAFQFTENGSIVHGQIHGSSSQYEQVWFTDVYGFITKGDPAEMEKLTHKVMATMETNPKWREQENARHQQKMAAMEQQTRQIQEQTRQNTIAHNQRMAQMQQNFDAHQQRMSNLQSANDSYNQAWMDNQRSQDRQHERFIDAIREEETVTNGSQQGKVAAGYNQYYVNPNTGQYIGTNTYQNPDASVYELWLKKD